MSHPRLREELRYFLEILALTGFVVAQPILDVFGRSPETFVFRGADRGDVVLFALIVVAVPPLVLAAGAALTNFAGPAARRWAQVVVLSALFGVLALQICKKATGLRDDALLAVAVLAGIGFALAYLRVSPVRLWVRYASVGPALFLVMFLVASPAADLVRTGDAHAADDASDSSDTGGGAPVVFFLLDELPLASIMRSDGTIAADLFPNLAELAASSTWYRNATTVALRTFYAIPAVLTGNYPDAREIPVSGNYPDNLFTWLQGSYDIQADETITRLCPTDLCPRGTSSTMPDLLDDARDAWRYVSSPSEIDINPTETLEEPIADEGEDHFHRQTRADARANTPERFEEFLDGIEPGESTLDFLHLMLPHGPSRYYPSGATYDWRDIPGGRGGDNNDTWTTEDSLVATQRERHLLQLQYADALVGRMIDRLKQQGVWDDAVVVVTADHGIAYTPGQSSRSGNTDALQPSLSQQLWVPMFVRAPGLGAGVVSDRNVETIDVLPTMADLAGVDLPFDVDGISMVGAKERPAAGKEFLDSYSDSGVEQPGTRRRVDAVAGAAELRRHTIDTFLPAGGDPEWAVYRAGPHPELVGTVVDAYARADAPAGSVDIDKPGRFERASPSEGDVPGGIWGTIDSADAAPGDVLAVAVNGTIAVTTRVLAETEVDFSVIPPDFLWKDGTNDVQVLLVVDRPDGTVELRPLTSS